MYVIRVRMKLRLYYYLLTVFFLFFISGGDCDISSLDVMEKEVNESENDYHYGFLHESQTESDQAERLPDFMKLKQKLDFDIKENNDSDLIAIRSLLFQRNSWNNLKDFDINNVRLKNKSKFLSKFDLKNEKINRIMYTNGKRYPTTRSTNIANKQEKRTAAKLLVNDDIINLVHINESVINSKLEYAGRQKKKSRNLDTYAESLLYVNKIYNKAYGLERRRVPAHMPHLLDRKVIIEMQKKFTKEFDKTSSHRLRDIEDMQFAFSYFYFLLSEKRLVTAEEIFDAFDTDKSQQVHFL
jgi:hypothetical protein